MHQLFSFLIMHKSQFRKNDTYDTWVWVNYDIYYSYNFGRTIPILTRIVSLMKGCCNPMG